MDKIIRSLLRIGIITYGLLHFLTIWIQVEWLEQALGFTGISMLILTLLHINIRNFKLPFFIFVIAIFVLFYSDTDVSEGFHYGMLQMRGIIGLLIVIPMISYVLREEPYIEDIMALFHQFISTSKRFYLSIVAFTQIIAYFLLFGSITMMHQFINIILKDQTSLAWENYKATALLRGFALSTMWVISIPSFIFAVETLGASLSITIFQGMAMAILGTTMAVIFAHFQEKKFGVTLTPILQSEIVKAVANASPQEIRVRKVIEFGLLFITLFGTVFLIHGLFAIQLMILIPLVIIGWVISFYTIKGRTKKIPPMLVQYYKHDLTNQAYQLSVMLAVGLLIYALNQTNFSNVTVESLSYVQEALPFLNVLSLLPFIIIFLGFVGLGPLTVMVLVAGILESMNFPYPPELIVLSVTSGSVISILISPLIMPVIVLSVANKLSLFTNGFKFNWKYAVAFYMLVQLYIQTVVYFGFFTS